MYAIRSYYVTLIEALEKSVNTAAVKLLKDVGIEDVVENFRKTGVDIPFEKDLTIALGSMSASPLDLAASYIPFANGGYSFEPSFRITSYNVCYTKLLRVYF